jgi:adenylate cyclase class 1
LSAGYGHDTILRGRSPPVLPPGVPLSRECCVSPWIEPFLRNGELFSRHNRRRIEYLRSCLNEKKRDVFDLIPLLLHEESAVLPGNIESGCPLTGITCFTYSQSAKELATRYFQGFEVPKKAKTRLPIVFLALMGSAGTISFTKESDMDFWVGVEVEKNDVEFMTLIKEKFTAIEGWAAATADLEVHFFLADLRRIRAEDYGELDKESCGSALGKLLKDEFYRTSLFLQGRIPFYWLMPVGIADNDYRDTILRMATTPSFNHENYVDLGNVGRINQSEYFGAALWQLLKGLRSPFKSALKMALLDMYSARGKKSMPLCESYKHAVLERSSRDFVDPYLFMIEELRVFYSDQNLLPIRRILEECFLIRNLLATGPETDDGGRIGFFRALGGRWGWETAMLGQFAGFREWDYPQVEQLNKKIINFFLETYKRIRTRTKEAGSRISNRDMTVVGKKLQSFFGKSADKVPYEFSLFQAKDVALIEMVERTGRSNPVAWDVKLRIKGTKGSQQYQIVRSVSTPLIGCAWCSLNHFYTGKQQLTIRGHCAVSTKEAVNIIRSLDEFFPDDTPDSLKIDDLLIEQYITHVYIVPNWESEERKSVLKSVFVFCRNTLGELSYASHSGGDCERWLTNTVLLDSVGRWHLRDLAWVVHVSKEVITTTRRVGEGLAKFIEEFMAQAV